MTAPAHIRDWTALAKGTDPAPALTIRQWRRLLGLGAAQRCKAGTRLFDQAAPARSIYLIESGLVKLSRIDLDGCSVTMLLRFPGDLVGIYGSVLDLPHFVSAAAVTDCQLLETPVDRALQVFRSCSEAAYFLAQRQSIDAMRLNLQLMEARLLTAEQRFFRLLLQLATVAGIVPSSKARLSVRVPLSEAEIADLIAMNRSAFSRLKQVLLRRGDLQQQGTVFSFALKSTEPDVFT